MSNSKCTAYAWITDTAGLAVIGCEVSITERGYSRSKRTGLSGYVKFTVGRGSVIRVQCDRLDVNALRKVPEAPQVDLIELVGQRMEYE